MVDTGVVVRPMPTQQPDRPRDGDARGSAIGSRGPLIHVSTRCLTIDEFVEKFSGFASYGALVLPAAGELPAGTEGRFVIRLADRSVAMRGRCRVTDVKTVPVSPAATGPRRTLLRVALLEMEEGSRTVHARLLAHRRQAVPLPVMPGESEPTIVSQHAPVPPPPVRPPPPPPVAGLARTMTMIGVAPPTGPTATKSAAVPPPPVNALARTMIGVAPGTGPTAAKVAAAQAQRRVPGAAFTLPANPLSAMHSDDLGTFIDSTLFETDDDDATAERAARPPEIDVPIEEAAAERAAPIAVVGTDRAAPIAVVGTDRTAPIAMVGAERAAPTAVVGPVEQTSPVGVRAPSRRALGPRLVPYAVCLIVGLLIGRVWLAPTRTPTPPPKPAALANPEPTAEAVAATQPAPSAQAPAVAKRAGVAKPPAVVEPAGIAAPPAVAESARAEPDHATTGGDAPSKTAAMGDCTARVITEPPDAKIIWGGKVLGQSPIAVARIPCGAGTLTIERERYQSVTRDVTAEPGAAVVVSQRLRRPPGTLIVSSSPPRAYVTVNDQMLGPAPRHLAASRYEQVSIRATYPGYLPWTKKIYLKEPTTAITAQLVPTGRGGDGGKRPPAAR